MKESNSQDDFKIKVPLTSVESKPRFNLHVQQTELSNFNVSKVTNYIPFSISTHQRAEDMSITRKCQQILRCLITSLFLAVILEFTTRGQQSPTLANLSIHFFKLSQILNDSSFYDLISFIEFFFQLMFFAVVLLAL